VYDPEGGGLLGYKVYSKETGTWEFVSADDWTPPPPPKQGEPTEPITYEDVIEEINKKKDPDPESGSGDGNNGGSGSQGGGSGQGEHAPREPNQYY
jgi:hypothetical protein